MKTKFYILFTLCMLFATTISAKQFTVVLDAGHGGKDPGAVGKIGQEKEINLNVALAVGNLITEKYPDVKVVYTRKTDKYVTLQERPKIANEADGDLFISIHTNASESSKAYGAETFTLGLSKSQANFEVAKRENSVLLLEAGNKETYQGFDPTSPESYIMFEFMQSKYVDQSVEIAYYIQKEFVEIKRLDRGVRQAIFWVLHQVKMPSILIELGFITNPSEEKFLLSSEGQAKLSNCIFAAFEKYKHEYDKRTITTPQIEQGTTNKIENKDSAKKKDNKKKKEKETPKNDSQEENTPKVTANPRITYKIQVFSSRTPIAPEHYDYKRAKKLGGIDSFFENNWHKYTCWPTKTHEEAKIALAEVKKSFKDAMIVAFDGDTKIPVPDAIEKEKLIQELSKSNIVFKIQVFSSRTLVPASNSDMRKAKKYEPVTHYTENGWYKYTCIETPSFNEAKELLKEIQAIFKDAVIVAFENGTKISITEALNKQK